MTAISVQNIKRNYGKLEALKGISFEVDKGEIFGIIGPDGAGKTTLLNLAGLLEVPDEGEVIIAGQNTSGLSERRRTLLRKKHIGLVFQFHRLFAEFSALENIVIPQMIGGLKRKTAEERAEALLAMVGLSDRMHHRPGLLSGGEQQRVAIARSVANAPDILLADEPTGNLDPQTADSVFQALEKIVTGTQTAALIVTHNLQLADRMHRRLAIQNGQVAEIG